MPDDCRGVKAERVTALLEPPADVDVVSCGPKLRIEAVDLEQRLPAVGHVAAGDVLGLGVRDENVDRPARRIRDAGGDRAVVGRRQVRAADGGVPGGVERLDEKVKPVRIGAGVIVEIGDDVAAGSGEAGIACGAEALVFGA